MLAALSGLLLLPLNGWLLPQAGLMAPPPGPLLLLTQLLLLSLPMLLLLAALSGLLLLPLNG